MPCNEINSRFFFLRHMKMRKVPQEKAGSTNLCITCGGMYSNGTVTLSSEVEIKEQYFHHHIVSS